MKPTKETGVWMTECVREMKRQLRDVYGVPCEEKDGELVFPKVEDGIYPMMIEGTVEYPIISGGKFLIGLPLKAPKDWGWSEVQEIYCQHPQPFVVVRPFVIHQKVAPANPIVDDDQTIIDMVGEEDR